MYKVLFLFRVFFCKSRLYHIRVLLLFIILSSCGGVANAQFYDADDELEWSLYEDEDFNGVILKKRSSKLLIKTEFKINSKFIYINDVMGKVLKKRNNKVIVKFKGNNKFKKGQKITLRNVKFKNISRRIASIENSNFEEDYETIKNLVTFPGERDIITVFPKKGSSINTLKYYSLSETLELGSLASFDYDRSAINFGSIYAVSDKTAIQINADILLNYDVDSVDSGRTGLLDPYFSLIFDLNDNNNNNLNLYLTISPELQKAKYDNAAKGSTVFGAGVIFGKNKNTSLPWSVGLDLLSIGESKDRNLSSYSVISGYGSLQVLTTDSAIFSLNFKARIKGEIISASIKRKSYTGLILSGNLKLKLQDLAYLDLSFAKELESDIEIDVPDGSGGIVGFDSNYSNTSFQLGFLFNF